MSLESRIKQGSRLLSIPGFNNGSDTSSVSTLIQPINCISKTHCTNVTYLETDRMQAVLGWQQVVTIFLANKGFFFLKKFKFNFKLLKHIFLKHPRHSLYPLVCYQNYFNRSCQQQLRHNITLKGMSAQ